MKDFRQIREIAARAKKTLVLYFCECNPPTAEHLVVFKAVKKLAEANKGEYVILVANTPLSEAAPLTTPQKLEYINTFFPGFNVVGASENIKSSADAASIYSKKYNSLIEVCSQKGLEKHEALFENNNYGFNTVKAVVIGKDSPDRSNISLKMRKAIIEGDLPVIKKCLLAHSREIDCRRMMNDAREGVGLNPIKEVFGFTTSEIREKYIAGEIFLEGTFVESEGSIYTIVNRNSNYVTVSDETGLLTKKWLTGITPVEVSEEVKIKFGGIREMKFSSTDKLKVAKIIGGTLGANVEKMSNPEQIVNAGLRATRGKTLNPESISIINKMLSTARNAGIAYDEKLVPSDVTKNSQNESIDPLVGKQVETNGMLGKKIGTVVSVKTDKYKKNIFVKHDGERFPRNFPEDKVKVIGEEVFLESTLSHILNRSPVIMTGKYDHAPKATGFTVDDESIEEQPKDSHKKFVKHLESQGYKVHGNTHEYTGLKNDEGHHIDTWHTNGKITMVGHRFHPPRQYLAKESTELEELSSETLRNYLKAAGEDARTQGYEDGMESGPEGSRKRARIAYRNSTNRVKGINRAADRLVNRALNLTKESTELDERISDEEDRKVLHHSFEFEQKAQKERGATPISVNSKKVNGKLAYDWRMREKDGSVSKGTNVVEECEEDLYESLDEGYRGYNLPGLGIPGKLPKRPTPGPGFSGKRKSRIEEPSDDDDNEIHDDSPRSKAIGAALKRVLGDSEDPVKGMDLSEMSYHTDVDKNEFEHLRTLPHRTGSIIKHKPSGKLYHVNVAGKMSLMSEDKLNETEYDAHDGSVRQWANDLKKKYPNAKIHAPEYEGAAYNAWEGKKHVGDWDGGGDDLPGRIRKVTTEAEEKIAYTADYKIDALGRKRRSRQLRFGSKADQDTAEDQQVTMEGISPEYLQKLRDQVQMAHDDGKRYIAIDRDEQVLADQHHAYLNTTQKKFVGLPTGHTMGGRDDQMVRRKVIYRTESVDETYGDSPYEEAADLLDDLPENPSEKEIEDMVDHIDDWDDIIDVYDSSELSYVDAETGDHIADVEDHSDGNEGDPDDSFVDDLPVVAQSFDQEKVPSRSVGESEEINEIFSRVERIKASLRFHRTLAKRERAIKIALKRRSSMQRIGHRARALAIRTLKKRLAKKPLNQLSVPEKERIERIIQRRKVLIDRIAVKLIPRVKQIENTRLSHPSFTKA